MRAGDIMHYQFKAGPDGRQEWVSRLVPHFYMDAKGRIVRNSYAVLSGRGVVDQVVTDDIGAL